MIKIKSSEITSESVYLNRRKFMIGIGGVILGAAGLPGCDSNGALSIPLKRSDSPDDKPTSFDHITTYNNFYEFTIEKDNVAKLARHFNPSPWQLEVGGLLKTPLLLDYDDLFKKFELEERIYRMRCVEGWSMIIPWLGFPLAKLLKYVEPLPQAKYVRFETIYDPERMPGQNNRAYSWPYVEGLRLDEAMNDLTFLSTGLYGKKLLPQCGAPIRLVVTWKYGFKSIKSIIKIILVEKMPRSLWMRAKPGDYGFYANVNPEVDHSRWSQASERRIGEFSRRETILFNGYSEEVSSLYAGMDLSRYF